ncbi:dipeptide epimerase [Ningiella sp. W23]|uniref:dipeptide epimerase n=1 Tax=Ningiella sp. W23 TaxID=3023715 RepID=UPI003756465E
MLVDSVSVFSHKVPLRTPFRTAIREVNDIHDIVIRLNCSDPNQPENVVSGFGSAPDTVKITGDSHESIFRAFKDVIRPWLTNRSLDDFSDLIDELYQLPTIGSNAKAAADIALHDAVSRYHNKALFEFLRDKHPIANNHRQSSRIPLLETDYTISVNDIQQMCIDIDHALLRNYRCLKIKIGNQPAEDLIRIKKIVQHIHKAHAAKDLALRLDVNQGWDAATTIKIMQTLEANDIHFELIEQPVTAIDYLGLQAIKANTLTPLMADESAFNLEQVKRLHKMQACDIVNIKLAKTGGLYGAEKIIEYCRQHSIQCMIGCMLEGSIGVAAAAHLAYAHPDVIRFIDLDGPSLGQYDPIKNATTFEDANIRLNTTPGLGIQHYEELTPWIENDAKPEVHQ